MAGREAAYSARRHAAEPGATEAKLDRLRQQAAARAPDPRLIAIAVTEFGIAPDDAPDWARAVWWGIAAGELLRWSLHDCERRAEALGLLAEPDWSALDDALAKGGVIAAAAHVGPPKFLMNALIDRYPKLLVLTNTRDAPPSLREREGLLMDPLIAGNRAGIMIRAAMHLRAGGLLLAAPDGGYGARQFEITEFGRTWRLSYGLPALAEALGVASFCVTVHWDRDRLVLQTVPIAAGETARTGVPWQEAWLMDYWKVVAAIIRGSPANLRFLQSLFRREMAA